VLFVAALLVRLTSRGPTIYRQIRLGKNGEPFTLYKLRTMTEDAEAQSGAVWAHKNDHRIIRFGYALRATHIDELPQLVNVLKGEMSLIGPRPERPELVEKLLPFVPRFHERLHVRPGLTGLAQLKLPPDSNLEGVRRKLICDRYYVRHIGPWLDFRILLFTVLRIIKLSFKTVWQLFDRSHRDVVKRPPVPLFAAENTASTLEDNSQKKDNPEATDTPVDSSQQDSSLTHFGPLSNTSKSVENQ